MAKNVKSTDPRKKFIVNFLKATTGANKVTLVKDNGDGTFSGHCMKGNRSGYQSLGVITVKLETPKEPGITNLDTQN